MTQQQPINQSPKIIKNKEIKQMYNNLKISKDEFEISQLFASELISAYKIIFSKLSLREIGVLNIDNILNRLEFIIGNRREFSEKELIFIKVRLKKLFQIWGDCMTNDIVYKEEFLNYKNSR